MNHHFKHSLRQAIRNGLPVLVFIGLFILLMTLFSCQRSVSFTDKAGTDWHIQGNRIASVDSLGAYRNVYVKGAYVRFNHMGSLDSLLMQSVANK